MLSGLSKKFTLVPFFVFVVFVLFLVEPSVAPVTMPSNPSSAPDISVVVHNNPEWVPPTYSTNSYTGEVKESTPGYWRASGTIEITIKNCPFTAYTDKNGNYINVYYSIFLKTTSLATWNAIIRPSYATYQSSSAYTVITFRYGGKMTSAPEHLWAVHDPGQFVDFRVQAVTGYFNMVDEVFEGEGSEWTEFTVTIPFSDKPGTSTVKPPSTSNHSAPSTSDIYNNSQQNVMILPALIIVLVSVCVIISLLVIVVYLFYSQQRKSKPVSTNS